MLCENAPDTSGILHRRCSDSQLFERHPLAVKHAKNVVVGKHKQLGGLWKGFVIGKPASVGVAVGTDDRQGADTGIKPSCDGTCVRLRREEPVLVEYRHSFTSTDAGGELRQYSDRRRMGRAATDSRRSSSSISGVHVTNLQMLIPWQTSIE